MILKRIFILVSITLLTGCGDKLQVPSTMIMPEDLAKASQSSSPSMIKSDVHYMIPKVGHMAKFNADLDQAPQVVR